MNGALKNLVSQFIGDPDNAPLSICIKRLGPTHLDLCDDLLDSFDSFSVDARLQIYPMLLFWVRPMYSRKILERRINSEADKRGRYFVQKILSSMTSTGRAWKRAAKAAGLEF
jgi:hypothetical protein